MGGNGVENIPDTKGKSSEQVKTSPPTVVVEYGVQVVRVSHTVGGLGGTSGPPSSYGRIRIGFGWS